MIAQLEPEFLRARPWKIWPRMIAYLLFEGRPLTTRGRWINPLVFASYRAIGMIPLPRPRQPPVFIMGVGRSGTTVLGSILALHRDVGYLNEPKAMWQAALGNDDLIGSYSKTKGQYRMTASDLSRSKMRQLHRFHRAFLALSGSKRVVDKYPELLFRDSLLDKAFPQASKIVIIRNGADICRSIEAWSSRNGTTQADWWGRNGQKWELLVDQLIRPDPHFAPLLPVLGQLTNQIDRAAVEWIASMRQAQDLQRNAAGDLHFIRYEDLVSDPAHHMQGILNFCGLSDDPVVIRYAKSTLRARSRYGAPNLHPVVQPLFEKAMADLGYSSEPAA